MAYPQVEKYLNRQLAKLDTVKTALANQAMYNELYKNKMPNMVGPDFELSIRKYEDQTEGFIPGGSGDYIGGDPASYSATTYPYRDAVQNFKVYYTLTKTPIRIDKIAMSRAFERGNLMGYFKQQAEALDEDAQGWLAQKMYNGTGDGQQGALTVVDAGVTAVATEPYGLKYQNRRFSATIGDNTNNNAANTHFGLARHLYPEFVGNEISAGAGNLDPGDGSTWITENNITLTNGNTQIPGLSSQDYSPYIGWDIFFRPTGVGSFIRMGSNLKRPRNTFVADATSGADTKIQMTSIFEGATGAYDIQLRPQFRADIHGAAGELTLARLYHALSYARHGNGKYKRPSWGMCDEHTLTSIMGLLQQFQRFYPGKGDSEVPDMPYEYAAIRGTKVIADDFAEAGSIEWVNTGYTKMGFEKGMDQFGLKKGSLKDLTDGRAVETLGGVLVLGMALANRAPHLGVRVTDLVIS